MSPVKIQNKYQITLPKAGREFFSLGVGDYIDKSSRGVLLRSVSVIPKDQRYFQAKEWQKKKWKPAAG